MKTSFDNDGTVIIPFLPRDCM